MAIVQGVCVLFLYCETSHSYVHTHTHTHTHTPMGVDLHGTLDGVMGYPDYLQFNMCTYRNQVCTETASDWKCLRTHMELLV